MNKLFPIKIIFNKKYSERLMQTIFTTATLVTTGSFIISQYFLNKKKEFIDFSIHMIIDTYYLNNNIEHEGESIEASLLFLNKLLTKDVMKYEQYRSFIMIILLLLFTVNLYIFILYIFILYKNSYNSTNNRN